MAKNRYSNNEDNQGRRPKRKMSNKEIIVQLCICAAILIYIGISDMFENRQSAANDPGPTETALASSTEQLDAKKLSDLNLELPSEEKGWTLYPYMKDDKQYYTLTVYNSGLGTAELEKPGYSMESPVRVNVQGDAGEQLIELVPRGNKIHLNESQLSGEDVDTKTYALWGDAASKKGLVVHRMKDDKCADGCD